MYEVDYCIHLEMKVECDVGMQLGTLVLSKCKCIIEYLSAKDKHCDIYIMPA